MAKLPENQYYIQLGFKEVLYDGTLRSIDDTAQNIWMMMFLQSLSYDEIGHFKVNGKPLLINEIAKVLGRDIKKLNRVLPILLKVGLCEQLEDGTIIIPSSKFDQLAGNLHAKCAQNDGKTTAKRRQNAEKNGEKQPKNKPPIKEKNINIKESPLTPQGENITILNKSNGFLSKSLQLLQEHTKNSEDQCRYFLDKWLSLADGNTEVVFKAVELGIHKDNPIFYIEKVMENYQTRGFSAPSKPKEERPSWALLEEKYKNDPYFQRLSRDSQAVALILIEGKSKEFMITYYKNNCPDGYRYWEKHCKDKAGHECEIIPLRVSA